MVTCKLCGYRGCNDSQSKCPVCDESYEPVARQHGQQGEATPGPQRAQAASGVWCRTVQQNRQLGAQALAEFCSPERIARATHFNIDLQSLLSKIPAQQQRRKKAEDILRAVGGGLTSAPADGQCDPAVVYIRPRADPTMTVLKVSIELPLCSYTPITSHGGHLASASQNNKPGVVRSRTSPSSLILTYIKGLQLIACSCCVVVYKGTQNLPRHLSDVCSFKCCVQGRYKTHPRAARSASMSALRRLAHPLIGYDSMEALAPNVRRRRQESIEQVSQARYLHLHFNLP